MKRRFYQPLNAEKEEIRLLLVKPGARLCFSLECFELGQSPAYYALSYTWGPANPGGNILVNERLFRVRANLLEFLERLTEGKIPKQTRISNSEHPLYIWIDQVCINQSNLEERGQQVQLMAEIYKHAAEVIVWLGNEKQDLSKAVQLVCLIAERKAKREVLWEKLMSGNDPWGSWGNNQWKEYHAQNDLCNKVMKDLHSGGYQPLFSIFHRRYWTRLWALQEFVLAKKLIILFDSVFLDGDTMQTLYKAIAVKDHDEMFGPANNFFKIRFHEYDWQRPSFHSAIMSSARLQCLDPRDRIFGILGFASGAASLVVVDYSKSGQEVFWDAFKGLKPLKGASWELNKADQIYELGLAMGVTGEEEVARHASIVWTCKQMFGGKTPQKVFGYRTCSWLSSSC
jgi:hypothetical protein